MNTLVVNAGSVTIKYKLYSPDFQELLFGQIDNKNGQYVSELTKNSKKYSWEITPLEYEHAAALIKEEIKGYPINKIGFRIVHGGEEFKEPVLLDKTSLEKLEQISHLAPLHNPPTLKCIHEFQLLMPATPLYGVFDTAYYAALAPKAYLYGLPYEYYTHYGVRKYGFHGISHQYLSHLLHELEPAAKKVLTCHLGGGASITATMEGKAVDTSMGFTPLEGLIMATRAGDVDDGAIKYIQEVTGFSDQEMEKIENEKSGLLGISGYTSDMRKLLEDEDMGNNRAHLAIEMYVYRIQKYIGSFAAAMDGVDAIAIAGGVGAGSDVIRKRIFEKLSSFGFQIDDSINDGRINVAENLKISTPGSKPVWILPTNEELQIVREITNI